MTYVNNNQLQGQASNGATISPKRMTENDLKMFKQGMKLQKDMQKGMEQLQNLFKKKKN